MTDTERKTHVAFLTRTDEDDFTVALECPGGEDCIGWVECHEPHEEGGLSAEDGPYAGAFDPEAPWDDRDVYDFHGQEHTWVYGHGWTIVHPGCPVGESDPDYYDCFQGRPSGRYALDVDWDDTTCYLTVIEEEEKP